MRKFTLQYILMVIHSVVIMYVVYSNMTLTNVIKTLFLGIVLMTASTTTAVVDWSPCHVGEPCTPIWSKRALCIDCRNLSLNAFSPMWKMLTETSSPTREVTDALESYPGALESSKAIEGKNSRSCKPAQGAGCGIHLFLDQNNIETIPEDISKVFQKSSVAGTEQQYDIIVKHSPRLVWKFNVSSTT